MVGAILTLLLHMRKTGTQKGWAQGFPAVGGGAGSLL